MKGVKCSNCVNYKAMWCEKVIDSPDPEFIRDCQHFEQSTEYDHICGMTVEEMAGWLFRIIPSCHNCFVYRDGLCDRVTPCRKAIENWLRSERVV